MTDDSGSPSLLAANELVVGYNSDPVCAPIKFILGPGEALGVVGSNGAGKSTLLQTLVGLLPPICGEVTFDAKEVDERRGDFRRDVVSILDDDVFFPSLSGLEHLLLTARGHGVPEADDIVHAEVEAFGLADRVDALPSRLSSGQRRRLALAAAFVRPARLLVFDEPERRLDAGMRTRLAARIGRARDEGAAVLFASHDAAFLTALADDVLLIGPGECPLLTPAAAADLLPRL